MDAAADDEPDDSIYAWEGIYERPWEAVVQASDGTLRGARGAFRHHDSHLRSVQTGVKRAVMRAVVLVVDASRASGDSDAEMRPSRLAVMVDTASAFVRDFFEQNPISTLSVLAMRDGRAEQRTESSCNPRQHLHALTALAAEGGQGDASLQNALELSRESLHATPSFTSREVVLLCASLCTCDPGDILTTIAALKKDRLRVSVFALPAEIFICKKVATDTGGDFGVPTSPSHLRDLISHLVPPRPIPAGAGVGPTNSLIRVGFPRRAPKRAHLTLGFSPGDGATPSLCDAPYRCPQCDAAHTELPTQCPVCARKLMSSVELTKTYHHLFPVPAYVEKTLPAPTPSATPPPTQQPIKQPIKAPSPPNLSSTPSAPVDERDARAPRLGRCFGCADALPLAAAATRADAADGAPSVREVTGFECPACGRPFCAACDELVHSVLRACPGCELIGGEARTQQP